MEEPYIKECIQILRKNQFEPIKRLGKGAFGLVFLVEKNGFYYSIKCTLKKIFNKKPQLKKYLKQQIEVMMNLHHPNIVQLHESFEDGNWIFMVTQYCDMGNLAKILLQKEEGVFDVEECKSIIYDLIAGLSYMHSRDILHRDIKLENILRTHEGYDITTKICDMGFSRQIEEDANTYCGTSAYMAPQIFSKQPYDSSVDVWALGVVLFTMLYGNLPFRSMNMELEIQKKCSSGFELSKCKVKYNSSLNKDHFHLFSELFKGIFQIDPKKRWTLSKITTHLFNEDIKHIKKAQSQSAETSDTDRDESLFELEEVEFIQWILKEIQKLKFLKFSEFLSLKYYLDKVCLSILLCERKTTTFTPKEQQYIDKLEESQKLDYHLLAEDSKEEGSKMKHKITIYFKEYKEEYRMTVGHAFSRAHQQIKNPEVKAKTKLKLLCCHLINRVFEKEHRNSIFQHFFKWKQDNLLDCEFDLASLKRWMEVEKEPKLVQTIELINNRFYKKTKN